MALSRIRATVTISAPVASVTVSASGSVGTKAGAAQAAITRVVPIADIKWVNIVYEAAVDYRGLNPVVREITVVVDAAVLGVGKGFVESHTAVDQLQPFVINKGIEENSSLTEIVVYEYSKSLADLVDATDDLLGEANLDDEQVMFLVKGVIPDGVATSDSDNILFGKNTEEQLSAVDSDPNINVAKGLDDQLNASEVLGFDYQKPLAESLDAGDEINGLVQSDDGQTFFMQTNRFDAATVADVAVPDFGKNQTDSLTTTDSLGALVLGKGIADAPQISEQTSYAYVKPMAGDEAGASDASAITFAQAAKEEIVRAQREGPNLIEDYVILGYFAGQYVGNGGPAWVFNKPFVEAKTVSDTVAVQALFVRTLDDTGSASESHGSLLEKPASDSASTSDAATRSLSAARADSVGSSDVLDKLFGRALSDSWTVSDVNSSIFGKALSDTGTLSESKTFDISKAVSDVVDAADDFDGTATAEDDQTMQFVTIRSDIAHTSDIHVPLVGKGLAEQASTGDSGSLRMTDYCDVSYFTDIYVGTSLTF